MFGRRRGRRIITDKWKLVCNQFTGGRRNDLAKHLLLARMSLAELSFCEVIRKMRRPFHRTNHDRLKEEVRI
jgi:hypothetical protein